MHCEIGWHYSFQDTQLFVDVLFLRGLKSLLKYVYYVKVLYISCHKVTLLLSEWDTSEWLEHHILSQETCDLFHNWTEWQGGKYFNPIPLNHSKHFFCHFYDNPFYSLTLLWSISLQKSLVGDLLSLLSIFRLSDRKIRLDVWIGQFWKSFLNIFSTDYTPKLFQSCLKEKKQDQIEL